MWLFFSAHSTRKLRTGKFRGTFCGSILITKDRAHSLGTRHHGPHKALLDVPECVLVDVFSRLGLEDRKSLSLTCKKLRKVALDGAVFSDIGEWVVTKAPHLSFAYLGQPDSESLRMASCSAPSASGSLVGWT